MNYKIKKAFSEITSDPVVNERVYQKIVRKRKINFALYVPSMAALVLFVACYITPMSYISIDVNPSLTLEVNAFNKVIDVVANNDDAKQIVNTLNIQHMNYVEAIQQIESCETFLEYKDMYKEVTVSSKNSEKILKNIENCGLKNMVCSQASEELRQEAQEYGVSFGKYKAYLELKDKGVDVDIEYIRDLPMYEIKQMLSETE